MTEEAKLKIDRQLKRHTKGGSSLGGAGTSFSASQQHWQPLRPSLSQSGQTPLLSPKQTVSPSHRPLRASEFDMGNSVELSQAHEASMGGHSPRGLHSRQATTAKAAASGEGAVIPLPVMLRRSISQQQRVPDVDLLPDPLSGASTTAGNSTDDSDNDRGHLRGRSQQRLTGHGLRTRLSSEVKPASHDLAVPANRRLHNLSVDSAAMSEEEEHRKRQSATHRREVSSPGRRQRLHLRTTSRDLQPLEAVQTEAPQLSNLPDTAEAGEERRLSVASARKSSRRFTRTRHSNAFDPNMRSSALSRYDIRGEPGEGSASISIAQSDGGDGVEEKVGQDLSPPAPAMSSSSDDSISPIRLPRHQRIASSNPSLTSPSRDRLGSPSTPSPHALHPSISLSPKGIHRASLARQTSRGLRLALLLSSSQLTHSLHSVTLHKLGYTVVSAGSVQEAVDVACEQRVEVLMMDWADGGEELVRGVREVEAERGDERTVILAMVDEPMDEETKRRSRAVGCSAVVESAAQMSAVLPQVIQRCHSSNSGSGSSSPSSFVYVDARMDLHTHTTT